MNEELQLALSKIIETVIAGKDFIMEQAPDVIQQLLAWKFMVSMLGFLSGIFVIGLSVAAVKWCIKSCKEGGAMYKSDAEGASVLCLVPIVGGVMIVCFNLTWLQIWIAPKVYLLEYASQLIK